MPPKNVSAVSVVMHLSHEFSGQILAISFAPPYVFWKFAIDQRARQIARHATFLKFPNNKPLRGQLDYRHVMNNGAPKEL